MTGKKRDDYVYSKLGDLKDPGVRFNVYGVVTQILKQNVRSGKGYHSMYYIKDESLKAQEPFRMHIFHQLSETITRIDVGYILRFHRVKIEKWEDQVDGRVFSSLDVVVFPVEDTGDLKFFSDATTVHYTDEVDKRVSELREMSQVMAICAAGLLDTSSSQNSTGKVLGLPEKRKTSSSSDDEPPARSRRDDADESEQKNFMANSACGKNRILNPSQFKPHKKLLLNPMHDGFKKLYSKDLCSAKKSSDDDSLAFTSESPFTPIGVQESNSSSSTVKKKKLLQSNQKGRENCNGFEDEQDKATTSLAILEGNQRSPEKCIKKTLSPSAFQGEKKSETKSSPLLLKSSGWLSTEPKPTFNQRKRKINEAKIECLPLVNRSIKNKNTAAVDQCHGKNLIASTVSLSHGGREIHQKPHCGTSNSSSSENDDSVSMNECEDSFASLKYPDLNCATIDCPQSGPVVLDDNDERLVGFKEEDLQFEGLGDIPAADEDGNSIIACTNKYMPYEGKQEIIQTTLQKLVNFKWPRSCANLRIIKIKPSLKVLKTFGPRDLVSGKCLHCAAYSPYSLLKWNKDHVNRVKRPMCPVCYENDVCQYVTLDYRMKFKARDASGTVLSVYAIKNDASKFLGCSLKNYQENEENRKRVTKLLLEALSSKSYFEVCLYRVNTLIKAQFYLCETSLPDVFLEKNIIGSP